MSLYMNSFCSNLCPERINLGGKGSWVTELASSVIALPMHTVQHSGFVAKSQHDDNSTNRGVSNMQRKTANRKNRLPSNCSKRK